MPIAAQAGAQIASLDGSAYKLRGGATIAVAPVLAADIVILIAEAKDRSVAPCAHHKRSDGMAVGLCMVA